jgi:hypothetical protein
MNSIGVSRPVRQTVATFVVVATMILPTLATCWWAWSVNRPGHVRDVEVRLSRMLGMQIGLDSVTYPRPGEIELAGVVFRQEEPRGRVFREVARAKSLAIHQEAEGGLRIATSEIEFLTDHAETAVEQFERILKKISLENSTAQQVTFVADRFIFSAESGANAKPVRQIWRGVAGSAELGTDQVIVKSAGWSNTGDDRTRCEFELVRRRQGEQAETKIKIATTEGPAIPASTLDLVFDTSGWFGDKAKLLGTLEMTRVESGPWQARFSGTLNHVDLAAMVNGRFGLHRLSGIGQLHIRTASWSALPGQGSGWSEIEGDLTSGPGKATHGLLLGMWQEMKFRLASTLTSSDEFAKEVEFGSLGMSFHLTDDGRIRFGGACGPDYAPDIVAVSASARPVPIMGAPKNQEANVRGLIKTLFPVNLAKTELLVPTTRESQSLQRYLPMPVTDPERAAVLPAEHRSGIIRR